MPAVSTCCRCIGTSSTRSGSWCSPWCTSSGAEAMGMTTERVTNTLAIPAPTAWLIVLAAGFCPAAVTATTQQLAAFHLGAFLVAVPIHLLTSLLVGVLYGATLPMLPRRPILLGGFIAPLMWSGLLYSTLGIINPVLNQRINWLWFVLSQVGFGIVAGIVVSRQERVRTWQRLPFAVRAGIEAPGMMHEHREDRGR